MGITARLATQRLAKGFAAELDDAPLAKTRFDVSWASWHLLRFSRSSLEMWRKR
jgi:hypothetical protein